MKRTTNRAYHFRVKGCDDKITGDTCYQGYSVDVATPGAG